MNQIEGACPDQHTVRILQNLYSGRCGETNAILQYVNQSYILGATSKDYEAALFNIAKNEMHHQHELGDAIVKFGGVPYYCNGNGRCNNFIFISCAVDFDCIAEAGIASEECAINDYKAAIYAVKNESLKKLLTKILHDEERHLEFFKSMRSNILRPRDTDATDAFGYNL